MNETRCPRFFGWYSNQLRGLTAKTDILSGTEDDKETIPDEVGVIQVIPVNVEESHRSMFRCINQKCSFPDLARVHQKDLERRS